MKKRQWLPVTAILLLSCAMGVHGWATLKKILIARLLSGPRVIAVPVPIPAGPPHHPPPLPPHPPPHPHPPPPLMPVPVPVHHYHYPPTNIWQSPLPKATPDIVTDLSHLHALYDSASVHAPRKQNYQYDVIDLGSASDVLSAAIGGTKSTKTASRDQWPTYSEPVATRRPSYASHKSSTYSTAQQEAYMAALKQYLKQQQYSSGTEAAAWSRPSMSYHNEPSKWAFAEDTSANTKEHIRPPITSYGWQYPESSAYKDTMFSSATRKPSSQDSYDWARYMAAMTKQSSASGSYDWTKHMAPTKDFSMSDNYDWASQVSSAYKSAAEKALTRTSPSARYDAAQQDAESYSPPVSSAATSTTESASVSESAESSEGTEASSPVASTSSSTASSTTTTTSSKSIAVPNPPPASTVLQDAGSDV